jgi:hypothetical protein
VLYVHSRASLASRRIGSLPHNARGVRNLGCQWSEHDHGTWCEIEWQGLRGFAAQQYLAEGQLTGLRYQAFGTANPNMYTKE